MRSKGLGEMEAHQLWDTTMLPERRTLLQVMLEQDRKRLVGLSVRRRGVSA
jgi:DNA gyrase/topoisomerase IV subunit B